MTASHSRRCWNTTYMPEGNLLWVWSGSSGKWVGCTNHNLTQHDTSEKPSESHTTTTVTVRPSISGWGCIYMIASRSSTFWITLYMHDKEVLWVWGGWGAPIITLHMLQVIVQDNHLLPLRLGDKAISCWGCILMTTSHNRRIRNTSYRYEDDLIGVWIGWGVSIIVYAQHDTSEKPSESPTPTTTTVTCDCETKHIRLGLHSYDCQPQ